LPGSHNRITSHFYEISEKPDPFSARKRASFFLE
jgi:hypothetical protein